MQCLGQLWGFHRSPFLGLLFRFVGFGLGLRFQGPVLLSNPLRSPSFWWMSRLPCLRCNEWASWAHYKGDTTWMHDLRRVRRRFNGFFQAIWSLEVFSYVETVSCSHDWHSHRSTSAYRFSFDLPSWPINGHLWKAHGTNLLCIFIGFVSCSRLPLQTSYDMDHVDVQFYTILIKQYSKRLGWQYFLFRHRRGCWTGSSGKHLVGQEVFVAPASEDQVYEDSNNTGMSPCCVWSSAHDSILHVVGGSNPSIVFYPWQVAGNVTWDQSGAAQATGELWDHVIARKRRCRSPAMPCTWEASGHWDCQKSWPNWLFPWVPWYKKI